MKLIFILSSLASRVLKISLKNFIKASRPYDQSTITFVFVKFIWFCFTLFLFHNFTFLIFPILTFVFNDRILFSVQLPNSTEMVSYLLMCR